MSTIGNDDDLFVMVNVRGHSSGLPMNIWIGPRGHAGHAARIKVQMDHRQQFDIDQLAIVSVTDDLHKSSKAVSMRLISILSTATSF